MNGSPLVVLDAQQPADLLGRMTARPRLRPPLVASPRPSAPPGDLDAPIERDPEGLERHL